MLREPVEMLYSLYHQLRYDANEHLPTFEAALAAENDRQAGQRLCRGAYFSQGLAYRGIARYTEQVRRYFDTFGRDRVRVVTYDELAASAHETYRGTLEFLGVDTTHQPESFRVINGNKSVRSRMLRGILTDPCLRSSAISAARRMGRRAFILLRRMEARLWALNTRWTKRPPLDPRLRAVWWVFVARARNLEEFVCQRGAIGHGGAEVERGKWTTHTTKHSHFTASHDSALASCSELGSMVALIKFSPHRGVVSARHREQTRR